MAQVTGIVKVKVNGKLLRSKPGAKLMTGGKERTPVTGHKLYGYAEKVVAATIECTLAHTADTKVKELNDLVGATAIFETDTGKRFTVGNCFTTGPCELTEGEGDLTLKLAGDPAEES
jgi:hypothetical protein